MTDIRSQMVNFPSNGQTTPGYLVRPGDANSHSGVVLIQEWWGLVEHIKDVANRFAREGFVALAPDLYHGKASTEPDEARKLAMEMDRDRAVKEIIAATKYLHGLKEVSPKKIGVVGWCMGGGLAIATAAEDPDLGAVVAFYGAPREMNLVRNICAPLLGLYGEHDHSITPEMVRQLDDELQKIGTPHEIVEYAGAGHAFFNDTRPGIYNPQAAEDAWRRTLDWFRKYLV